METTSNWESIMTRYHLTKKNGCIIHFSDTFSANEFSANVIHYAILRTPVTFCLQMKKQLFYEMVIIHFQLKAISLE